MAHQPATNNGTSAADPTQAVEIDLLLMSEGRIEGIENFTHDGRCAGDTKVTDGEALVNYLNPTACSQRHEQFAVGRGFVLPGQIEKIGNPSVEVTE